MKGSIISAVLLFVAITGVALAQQYPTNTIQLFTGTAPVQSGNSAISGTFGAGTSNACSATSGVPCSGNITWNASGTSTASSPVPVPSACQNPVITRNSGDVNTTGSITVATTASPYPNSLVLTKAYATAAPTASAAANYQCD